MVNQIRNGLVNDFGISPQGGKQLSNHLCNLFRRSIKQIGLN